MDLPRLFAEIHKHIERNQDIYKYVLIQSTFARDKPEYAWKHCMSKISFLEEKVALRKQLLYDVFAMAERLIPLAEFEEFLNKLGERQFVFNKEFNVALSTLSPQHHMFNGGFNDYHDWPCHLFVAYTERITPPQYPPVKYGEKPFLDGRDALAHWLQLKLSPANIDPYLGDIIFCFPVYRARLQSMQLKENVLEVDVECHIPSDQVECQIVCKGLNGERFSDLRRCDKLIKFILPFEPIEFYIQLITSNEEKVDWYHETQYGPTGSRRLLHKHVLPMDLDDGLKEGEGVAIEYKPFIDIKDTSKFSELIETAVAFANAKGGVIFLGVTDSGVVEGIDIELSKMAGKSLRKTSEDILTDLKPKYKQKILNGMTASVPMEIQEYVYGGKTLLVIKVEEGTKKLYGVKGSNILKIRKGATNMAIHPDEIPQLIESGRVENPFSGKL